MSFSVSSSGPVRTCSRRLPLSFFEAAGAVGLAGAAVGAAVDAPWQAASSDDIAARPNRPAVPRRRARLDTVEDILFSLADRLVGRTHMVVTRGAEPRPSPDPSSGL